MSFRPSHETDITHILDKKDTTSIAKQYYISDYQINTISKTISRIQMVGGIDWDGYDYFPDSTICYDTTSLIFVSGQVLFKEILKDIDFETLIPINYKSGTFRDKNGIYISGRSTYNKFLSLNDLQKINDDTYINANNDIIYINQSRIPISYWNCQVKPYSLDTLIHLADGYFIDKAGLYNAAEYKATEPLMIFSDSVIPKYEIFNSYIRVGDKLFARTDTDSYLLDLNPENTKEYTIDYYGNRHYIITDGTKTYYFDTHYPSSSFTELKELRDVDLGMYIGSHEGFLSLNNDYYSPKGIPFFILFYNSKTKIYTNFSPSVPQPIEKLYIKNRQKKCMDLFDTNKYRQLINDLYIYDGVLYSFESKPVAESFDIENLHQVKNEKISSSFVTDNKRLLYVGEIGGYSSRNDSIIKESYITDDVDFESLEILTPNILIDKNNIYVGRDSLEIIPRKKLGIELKFYY